MQGSPAGEKLECGFAGVSEKQGGSNQAFIFSVNFFWNFFTLGATTNWQYGWDELLAKYSWW
jgi:hypothetical protein